MTKKQAQSACEHEDDALTSTYNNWISANGNNPLNLQHYLMSVDCEISN